jgi:branched-chain amino acid aminotransferase
VTTFWVGSGLVEAAEATVSVLDHGLTVGDGVFETLLVRDGVPFALTRHLARLSRSLDGLGIVGPPESLLMEAVAAVVARSGPDASRARLRITVTSGTGPLGSERGGSPATLVVTLTGATPWPATTTVASVPWVRNERSAVAGLKTTSYAENAVALAEAHRLGASEALLADTQGRLCEGTGSNVFVVVDGEILTPSLRSGCLAGVTRELVLEWGASIAPVREVDLPYDVVRTADEVFLTSSTRDVHPVVRVDGRELPAGSITADLARAFVERAVAEVDP